MLTDTGHRLLIQSCSRAKIQSSGLTPAIDRYDGPAFRLLRRFRRLQSEEANWVDIHILSAEFGLISAEQPIEAYDRAMTLSRATELRPQVAAQLNALAIAKTYTNVFVNLGATYTASLPDYPAQRIPITFAIGSAGRRLSLLRQWLYRERDARRSIVQEPDGLGNARLQGVDVHLSPAQILELAREALRRDAGPRRRFQTWFVEVDGEPVAPKWLVSQITDLPVSAFHTQDALRLLSRLGVEIREQ